VTIPEEQAVAYERASFGGRLRLGDTPAVLVVDLTLGFTDPAGSFGSDLTAEVEATRRVLDAARAQDHLVIFSTVGYDPSLRDTGVALEKAPRGIEMVVGGDSSILDPRLGQRPDEVVILKRAPSALFGTSVPAVLMGNRIDTVVLCGAVTSGCIRATCVDLYSYGLPTLIPRDCVGDRAQGPHEANLYDMQAKYADVVGSDEAIGYLLSVSGREGRESVQQPQGLASA
jgi:maleamate amidohydrolase